MDNGFEIVRKNGRIQSFNTLRVFATFIVVYSHVLAIWSSDTAIVDSYWNAGLLRNLIDDVLFYPATRWGLPSFFMITGALLLDPKKDLPTSKIKKYILRMIEVILIFGYVFALMVLIGSSRSFHISYLWEALLAVFQEESFEHLWYLYALIGLYIVIPLLRSFIASADEKDVLTLLGVFFVLFLVVPTVNSVLGIKVTSFGLSTERGGLFYLLFGYAAVNMRSLKVLNRRVVYLVLSIGLLCGIAMCLYGLPQRLKYKDPNYIWSGLIACSVFWLAVRSKWVAEWGSNKAILFFDKHSFCIYLLHVVPLHFLMKIVKITPVILPPLIGEVVFFAFALVCACVGSVILHMIPGIKKLI